MRKIDNVKSVLLKNRKLLKEKYGIVNLKIFGSYARGEETPKSDIDILVEFNKPVTLLDIVRIERELSQLLQLKVDLLTEKAISHLLIDRIKNETITILNEKR